MLLGWAGGGGGGGGGQCPPSNRSVGAIAPTALKLPMPLRAPVQCMLTSPVTCVKNTLISDVEAIGHDHVEETMGYEHTVEGMSTLLEAMRHE